MNSDHEAEAEASADAVQSTTEQETGSLARELAGAYRQMAAFYRDQLQLAGPEADARARGVDYSAEQVGEDDARIREGPPDQVSWFDLNRLAERNPDQMVAVWSHIKSEAQRELACGQRTARALEWRGGPWQRAQFLAIRDNFRAGNPPQSGIESALVETAAEAFGDYLAWSEHLHMLGSTEVESERRRVERDGEWTPMRLSYAEALEQSAKMAERAHKRFLQTVKLLHDLQRSSPALYVGHAAQVNVGQQQVYVASAARRRRRSPDLPKSLGRGRLRPQRPAHPLRARTGG